MSPFSVVDKAGGDPMTTGSTIHDLSYPEGISVNDKTDGSSIERPEYRHCDAVVSEIMSIRDSFPGDQVLLQASNVNSAFRNISIHSDSVQLFAGVIPEVNALVIDLSPPFGWTGLPGEYEIFGGAVSYIHGRTSNNTHVKAFPAITGWTTTSTSR